MADADVKLNRREVLVGGAATLGVSGGCATVGHSPSSNSGAPQTAVPTVPTVPTVSTGLGAAARPLGRLGVEVPIVSMGVMNADNPGLVRAALERGVFLLDTAHTYQDGRNEEMVGEVVAGRPRDSYFLCTKVRPSSLNRSTGLFAPDTRWEELTEKIDLSLKRLQLDHVDVLYLHAQSRRESVLNPGVLDVLDKAKRAGKVRFIGVSTHKNEPEVIRAAIESKRYDVVLTAYNFRQEHHLEVKRAIGEASAAGLGIVAMKTQAGVYWDEERKQAIEPRAALRWALRDPSVHTSIPGFTTLEQLEADLEVLQRPAMDEDDEKALKRPEVVGFYCSGCEQCVASCRERLPLPELMRGYMYQRAYRNPVAALALLDEVGVGEAACMSCEACAVSCPKGFEVKRRVRELTSWGAAQRAL